MVSLPFPTGRSQSLLEKWLLPGLGQESYKINLEYLVIADSTEVIVDH